MRILKEPGAPPVLPSLLFFLFSRKWIADTRQVEEQLKALYDEGFRSLAIVFVHSYTYPQHEEIVGNLARKIGFEHVSESSKLVPMIKMVLRGVSSTADAYLTPILRQYLDGFFSGFDKSLKEGTYHADELAHEGALEYHLRCAISDRLLGKRGARVEFMASDGGLVDLNNFSGLKSILSGPAGGVVGYALTSWDGRPGKKVPVIGYVNQPCSS